jgi:ParB/RepB/Spo0J family partition protein
MLSLAATPVTEISVDLIDPSPLNPRKHFAGLEELAESLKIGQLEAIIVRVHPQNPGRFELANGERRWRAAKLAVKATLDSKVRELTDSQMLDIMLGSGAGGNVQQLDPLEEAAGYAKAMEVMNLPLRGVAEHFHRDETIVRQRVALLELPAWAKDLVTSGELKPTVGWLIGRIPDPEKREAAAQAICKSPLGVLSFREAKKYIDENICRALGDAPFAREDAALVPEAGSCTACPFNTANDREAYGDTSANRCMAPACFEKKVAAARARVLAQETEAGKKPLKVEVNAEVFPPGAKGLAWNSGHVEFSKRPPADLLKAEVAKVPTWRELCGDRVTVRVGIDQSGRAVDVVKLDDALAAVPPEEVAIFRDEVIRKHQLAKTAPETRAERSASQLQTEQAEQKLREKADRQAKLREKKGRAWLDDLVLCLEGLAASKKPAWASYTYWSLMAELMLRAVGDDDVRFVCELFGVEVGEPGAERAALKEWLGQISGDKCGAVVTALTIAPWLRAEGPDAPFVTEWHGAFLTEKKEDAAAGAETAKASSPMPPTISKAESDQLAQLVKAYGAGEGMSPQRCAEEFGMPLADVCGALQLDARAVQNVVTQLRQDAEEAFVAAKIVTPGTRNRVVKTGTGGRVKEFENLTRPEDFRKVISMLAAKVNTKPRTDDAETTP